MRAYTRRKRGEPEADDNSPCEVCGEPTTRQNARFCSHKCANIHFNRGGQPVSKEDQGFVYVLTHPAFPGSVKVGRTNSPRQRLSTYNTGCPGRRYKFAAVVPVHDAASAESAAAELLRGHALLGEWFQLHPTDAVALLTALPSWSRHDPTN